MLASVTDAKYAELYTNLMAVRSYVDLASLAGGSTLLRELGNLIDAPTPMARKGEQETPAPKLVDRQLKVSHNSQYTCATALEHAKT